MVSDSDTPAKKDTVSLNITITELPYICGDVNANVIVNITDVVYLIQYIYGSGPAPNPLTSGDVNCNEVVNLADVVYLVQYIFVGGPEPCSGC